MVKKPGAQEVDSLFLDLLILRKKRVGGIDDDVVTHAGHFCAFHRDLAVIIARNKETKIPDQC